MLQGDSLSMEGHSTQFKFDLWLSTYYFKVNRSTVRPRVLTKTA